ALPLVALLDVDRFIAVRRERDLLGIDGADRGAPRSLERAAGVAHLDPVAVEIRRDVDGAIGDERRAVAARQRRAGAERRQDRGLADDAAVVDRQVAVAAVRSLDPDAAGAAELTAAAPRACSGEEVRENRSGAERRVCERDRAAAARS